MHLARRIIVIIREMERCAEALRTAAILRRSGASVALFCLCALEQLDRCDAAALEKAGGIDCYASDAAIAARMGIGCLPLNAMAERIKTADMVIPL